MRESRYDKRLKLLGKLNSNVKFGKRDGYLKSSLFLDKFVWFLLEWQGLGYQAILIKKKNKNFLKF